MSAHDTMTKEKTHTGPGFSTSGPDPFAEEPWTIDVDIWQEPKNGKDFYFETYMPHVGNDITFDNHRRKGYIINFNLRDADKTGYFFPDDLDEALYSATGAGCPMTKHQWQQFKATGLANGNRTLIVRNENNGSQIFGYTLRVKKGTDWKNLDPGGNNNNGSSS